MWENGSDSTVRTMTWSTEEATSSERYAPGSGRVVRGRRWLAGAFVWAFVVVAVTACGGSDDAGGDSSGDASSVVVADGETIEPGLVTPGEAAELAASGITVIDVRTPEEFAEGHLADATLIDFYDADFADQIAALPTDQEYVLYCRSGNRSGQTFALMEELGFEQVYDMDGGIIDYAAEGLPLVP